MHSSKTHHPKMKLFILAVCILIFLGLALAYIKRPVGDYSKPETPKVHLAYSSPDSQSVGELKVVTWNLHQAADLPGIIQTLETTADLQGADLYLFQEIDAVSADELADELHLNYVYSPAAFDRKTQKEFGNAIFTKWPIDSAEEIILPNWHPGWVESRNAVKATIAAGRHDVTAYSVHTDVLWMEPQGEYLSKEILKSKSLVILGGDFNTWRLTSIVSLEKNMTTAGLERLTRDAGYTFEVHGLHFTLDHIFANTGLDHTSGVYRDTQASDHYPVWVVIKIDADK